MTRIQATSLSHLKTLIAEQMQRHGTQCSLNHIDVSGITNMSYLFERSNFKGDIFGWDVSQVTNMRGMFYQSEFNGDLSRWDVSNVTSMDLMFEDNGEYFGRLWRLQNQWRKPCESQART